MNVKITIPLLFLCVAGILSSQSAENSTLAIMDVVPTNISNTKSQLVYEYLIDTVNDMGIYQILERSALQQAIDEIEIASTGLVDDSTAAQIGQLVGAEYIMISNLIGDDGDTYLSARIVTVESGQVSNTAIVRQNQEDGLEGLVNQTMIQLLDNSDASAVAAAVAITAGSAEQEKEEQTTRNLTGSSPLFISAGLTGLVPLSDDSEIFTVGFGATGEFDWRVTALGPGNLFIGAGTGLLVNFASEKKGVVYPYTMMTVPVFLSVGYEYQFGSFYLNTRLSGGYSVNIFMYKDTSPFGTDPETSFNPIINPGLSFGYRINDQIGISAFADWTMIFFKDLPYTALGFGIAVDINL